MDGLELQLLQFVYQDPTLAFHKVNELLHELPQMRVCRERLLQKQIVQIDITRRIDHNFLISY